MKKITVEDIAKREYITENYFSHFGRILASLALRID